MTIKSIVVIDGKEVEVKELEDKEAFKELSTTSNDAKMTLVKAKPGKKAAAKKG